MSLFLRRIFSPLRINLQQWTTAESASNDACIAIFADLSTPRPGTPIILTTRHLWSLIVGAGEASKMRQLRALLRKTPSRIGRRIAELVAIAAASLPAAGA